MEDATVVPNSQIGSFFVMAPFEALGCLVSTLLAKFSWGRILLTGLVNHGSG